MFILGMTGLYIVQVQLYLRKPGQLSVKGLYRISRHPYYLMMYITWIGIEITTVSRTILVSTVFYMIINHFIMIKEENI